MVEVVFLEKFKQVFSKIKDPLLKIKIIKQTEKIKSNPDISKPMRFSRKGTREIYIKPFRLSYIYYIDKDLVYILDIYHKDKQ